MEHLIKRRFENEKENYFGDTATGLSSSKKIPRKEELAN